MTAYYLYTAMAANPKDLSDSTRWKDLFCYPFVKENGEWKMKIARFIPEDSYESMSLDDPTIMEVCQDFEAQATITLYDQKEIGKLDLGANEEKALQFDYDPGSDSISPL